MFVGLFVGAGHNITWLLIMKEAGFKCRSIANFETCNSINSASLKKSFQLYLQYGIPPMRAPMTTWSWRTNERERRRKPISLPLNFRGNCVFDVRNGQRASERIEILSKHLTQSQRGKILPEAQRGEGLNPLLTLSNTLVRNLVVTKFTQPRPFVTIFLADKSLH